MQDCKIARFCRGSWRQSYNQGQRALDCKTPAKTPRHTVLDCKIAAKTSRQNLAILQSCNLAILGAFCSCMRKDDGIATLPPSGPWIVTPPPRPQGILCVIVRLPPRPPATSCNLAIVQSCNLASIWWLHLQSCNLTTRSNLAFFPTCSLKWFTVCPLSYTNHYGDDVQDLP